MEQTATRRQHLPEECWELVFDRLKSDHDHQHLESVSLVCKHFLSISNRLHSSLNIIDPLITLSVLLQRFHHLNRINLDEFHGGDLDLDLILTQLSKSGLKNLQALNISNQKKFPEKGLKELGQSKMKNSLKILICARLKVLLNKHLSVIGDSLPYLEELDISFPKKQDFPPLINDAGIVNLFSKLPNLRKMNISGIHGISLDSTLLAILSNCVFLTHITADNFIPSIIYNSPHLISLTVNETSSFNNASPPPDIIESSLVSSRYLRVLEFSHMVISDEFLFSVREADFPLMKLSLSCCRGFTINGIDSFLCGGYRSLKHLDLQGADFLTDQSVFDLSKYMHGLNFIGLNSCSRLTSSTFFTLARNCPRLQEIRMESTSLGEKTEFLGKKNLAIRVLKFACNTHLNDKTLEKIGFVCPKLESLDVSRCLGITEHGIHEVGKRCSEVREVKMVGCRRICDFLVTHNSSEFSKLEVLDAMRSGISDGGLSRVGCNCIGLQRLVLECCFGVTEKGVIEVVKKSKRLRELNLKNCSMTIVASLSWIVFSRPSLRKIIPPGEADFPLMKKLSLSCCRGFTINGIDTFLCSYRSLKHLDLQGADFLTDQSVSDLSKDMYGLNFIGLNSCSRLTSSTFFTLARKCPCLQEIRMESTSLGENDFPVELLGNNLAIRVLKFACNTHLNDKTLEKIGFVCPKLESLDVSRCLGITEHGIHEVGKICSEVREVKMVGCKRICDFLVTHNSSEFSKLEDLNAMSSRISDGGLSRVGYNCIRLQRLVLECCFEVTEKGVIEVVKKCKRLRELNLKNCSITIVASLNLIVFSRPSLRKIIPPGGFIPGKRQKDMFLRRGCMVRDD